MSLKAAGGAGRRVLVPEFCPLPPAELDQSEPNQEAGLNQELFRKEPGTI